MANVTLYTPSGAPVSVSDTPASYVARLLARGYTTDPPGPAPVIYTKTVLASAARTVDGETGAIAPDTRALAAGAITFGLQITAVGASSPAVKVWPQWFSAAAGVWFDQDPAEEFASHNVLGAWMLTVVPRGDFYRIKWDVTDSVTFAVLETALLN
jgi:hypothetical protein